MKECQSISSSKSFELEGRISVRSSISSDSPLWGYSCLVHGPWVCTSRPRAFPVENEWNKIIPPQTMQLLHSWTTFSGDLQSSLLQQTEPRNIRLNIHFCSKSSNQIFAMTIATHIPHRHLAAIILVGFRSLVEKESTYSMLDNSITRIIK